MLSGPPNVFCDLHHRACVAARLDSEALGARLFEWELQHVPGERTRLTYCVDDALKEAGFAVRIGVNPSAVRVIYEPASVSSPGTDHRPSTRRPDDSAASSGPPSPERCAAERVVKICGSGDPDVPGSGRWVDPPGLFAHLAAPWQEPSKRDRR